MKYGYDKETKCLFSWDGDFKYEGKHDVAPDDAFVVGAENRAYFELAACHFLSGIRRNCLFYFSAGEQSIVTYGDMTNSVHKWTHCNSWKEVVKLAHPTAPVCVCGEIAHNPTEIAELCRMYPCHTIYVCPVVEELAAFGVLVTNLKVQEKPRRTSLCIPNTHDFDGESVDFDPKLEGDGYGRMADVIHKGMPVLNEMMMCPGISPFYGRVISRRTIEPHIFLLRSESANRYFPTEPVSAKVYAATSVPVEVTNTKAFMHASGCQAEKVNIVVSSDYIPGLPVFLNFYKIMSGDDFVGTICPKQMIPLKKTPVFGYSRGHMIDPSDYKRIVHAV